MIDDAQSGLKYRLINEFAFNVSGVGNRPITEYMTMKFGTEFSVGAGFRVLLRRADHGILTEFEKLHPFACLLDQSC